MTMEHPTPRPRKRTAALLVATAAVLAAAGTAAGVSTARTGSLCSDAVASVDRASEALSEARSAGAGARSLADGTAAYTADKGATALLLDLDEARHGAAGIELSGQCGNRGDAQSLRNGVGAASEEAESLHQSADRVTSSFAAFQVKARVAAKEKAAAEAESLRAAEAAAAAVPALSEPVEEPQPAPAVDTSYTPPATVPVDSYVPPAAAPPAAAPYVPAPAPAPVPAPAPAPAPGWTPPPYGSGNGGPVCVGISDTVFCTGGATPARK